MEKTTTTTETAVLGSVSLCSNLMRAPQVFDQYGPSIAGVARDLVIWAAWNGSKQVRLNVKQFAEMFGYTRAFLFKRINETQETELRRSKFGPEFKDMIGYALAKLQVQNLVFPDAAPYVAADAEGVTRKYRTLTIIRNLTSKTSRTGTSYEFEISAAFLGNCRKRYQSFNLDTYLQLKDTQSRAYSSGRKMYLHLCWKRKVWDASKKQKGVRPSEAKFDELIDVAGFTRKDERRTAHEVRQLLEDLAHLPGVRMSAEVAKDYQTEQYGVTMKRHAPTT